MTSSVPVEVMRALELFAKRSTHVFREADWLLPSFDAPVWRISLGGHITNVDWQVRFGHGKLTDDQFYETWQAFRSWIVLQTHPRVTRGSLTNVQAMREVISRALAHIDYFLLHQEELKLADCGLIALTENDLMRLLLEVECHASEAESLYGWRWRLASWLDKQVALSPAAIAALIEQREDVREISHPKQDWKLEADQATLIKWRAALLHGQFYRNRGCPDYRLTFSTTAISKILYRDTLKGKTLPKPLYRELCLRPTERCIREKLAVPVRSDEGRPAQANVTGHRTTLFSMAVLAEAGLAVPANALRACESKGFIAPEAFREMGRYATLPFRQTMGSLRQAIDLILDHGEHLIVSYSNMLVAANLVRIAPADFAEKHTVRQFLTEETLQFGIQDWSLGRKLTAHAGPSLSASPRNNSDRVAYYFAQVRANRGLVECLRILFGAMEFVFGAMTARRLSELIELPLVGALDIERKYVVFKNRKSGSHGLRQEEARPIPPICAEIVRLCEVLHSRIAKVTASRMHSRLFDLPGVSGMRSASVGTFYDALDAFCDYIQSPTDRLGRRWYIRQHQLRKFFVMAFYYGASWSNLATLRWMLGQTDAKHLWHYITKEIPGAMIEEAASSFLVDALQSDRFEEYELEMHNSAATLLADTVLAQFGTRTFSIIDAASLDVHVRRMIGQGLRIEPHFIDGLNGNSYRIAVTCGPRATI